MANANTPFGLRPVRYLNGAPWNGQVTRYHVKSNYAVDLFIGDPVVMTGDTAAYPATVNGIPADGLPNVQIGVAGSAWVGAIVGFEVNPGALDVIYGPASTARIALVADDPNLIFEMQEIGTGTPLAATDQGLNANGVAASGSTVTGLSGWVIDNTTEATSNTLNVKLMRLVQRADMEGYGAYAKWEVMINNHLYRAGATGV
jgi:hypothetical protein